VGWNSKRIPLPHNRINSTSEKLKNTQNMALDCDKWTTKILEISEINPDRAKYLHPYSGYFLPKEISE
jgi:hypothetical protein